MRLLPDAHRAGPRTITHEPSHVVATKPANLTPVPVLPATAAHVASVNIATSDNQLVGVRKHCLNP
ncbi:MAG: hypothetical protein KC766_02105 [Myxococcales bacterium]|nr:hypothetical protein [Myxococcales bacterium]